MATPWAEYLQRFERTLARPSRDWSEAESVEVWDALAGGPVGNYLFRCLRRRVGNDEDAEDILQQCLAEMSLGRTFDPSKGGQESFRKWVHSCLYRHLAKFFGVKKIRNDRFSSITDPDGLKGKVLLTDGGDQAAQIELDFGVATYVGRLRERDEEIYRRKSMGESSGEIAAALGLTEVNVRQILFRIRHDLREKVLRSTAGRKR